MKKSISNNKSLTAITACHRYESSNHNELGRLVEFKLEKLYFIGSPKIILNSRKKTIQISKKFFNDWNLSGIMQSEKRSFLHK